MYCRAADSSLGGNLVTKLLDACRSAKDIIKTKFIANSCFPAHDELVTCKKSLVFSEVMIAWGIDKNVTVLTFVHMYLRP